MMFKYVLTLILLMSILQAKIGTCPIDNGKEKFIECLQQEALKTNNNEDIDFLASFYAVDKEYEKAIQWYEKSANQGDAKAAFFLGGIYDEALGTESDKFSDKVKTYLLGKDKKLLNNQKEAIKWYKKAAKADYDDAMPHMNEMMEKVYGKEGTIKIYKEAIKKGEDVYWNKRFLANFYFRLHKYNKREEILKELIKEYPEQKADWLTMIADAYTKNYMNNKEMEVKYYKEAAKAGSTNAMHNIGLDYAKKHDYKTAEMWFRKAGHGYMVCLMYKDIAKDKKRALECYEKEAESGEINDIGRLAYIYQVEFKEYNKAFKLYENLIDRGDNTGALNIAVAYRYHFHDNNKSIFWYKKAASMGNEKAIKHLIKKGLF